MNKRQCLACKNTKNLTDFPNELKEKGNFND